MNSTPTVQRFVAGPESEEPEAIPSPFVSGPVISEADVSLLLQRASMATPSNDAIIAIVDRTGRILGVRTEFDVDATYAGRTADLVFAIDGAVAKARTAAFFSNSAAPLTSRTIRFISQSTITQREVESNPNIADPCIDTTRAWLCSTDWNRRSFFRRA